MQRPSNNIAILGSTGSIGKSTLDVIRSNSDLYNVWALAGHSNIECMREQVATFQPEYAVMVNESSADVLRQYIALMGLSTEVLSGQQALNQIAEHDDVDIVVAGIVGVAGMTSTLAATNAGKKVLLANKESLVCAGSLIMDSVRKNNATLMPLDSEHNAIFQCFTEAMQQQSVKGLSVANNLSKVILTASGGPLLNVDKQQLSNVTPAMACAHPNWSMGRKISVDSATMMNKGLEYIEACVLFGLDAKQVDVVIHPQSIIHSLVEYDDGSLLAQLGVSDMNIPISYALGWPKRIDSNTKRFSFSDNLELTFKLPDYEQFPCLQLAMNCMKQGQSASLIMNIANEVMVEAFLQERISFDMIYKFVAKTLEMNVEVEPNCIDSVIMLCNNVRRFSTDLIHNI